MGVYIYNQLSHFSLCLLLIFLFQQIQSLHILGHFQVLNHFLIYIVKHNGDKDKPLLLVYGDDRSMIDYLMVRKTDRCLVKDVKVISSEECIPQHQMVIGRLVLPMKPQKKKIVKFVPKPRVWKLKDDETAIDCLLMKWQLEMMNKADDIQKKWLLMKEIWLKGSKQVCGMTKGPPRHKETWWWNRDVEKVVAKRNLFHKI